MTGTVETESALLATNPNPNTVNKKYDFLLLLPSENKVVTSTSLKTK